MNTKDLEEKYEWLFIAIPVFITAVLWFGTTQVLYSADDYQYLHHFAPIRSIGDFFKQFYTADPNSLYWRPLASGLAVTDFLMWGWNGMGFHVTNFILHLICTVVIYFTAKNIFKLSPILSSSAMLGFGCAASHESNLLWAAGRTDSLATIFILAALLAEQHFRQHNKMLWKMYGLLFFLLAMLSKEIGIFVIPLIVIVFDLAGKQNFSAKAKRAFFGIFPYCILLALIIIYRSQFVTSLPSQSDVIGIHSIRSLAMNSIYTIGYTLIPLDFETGTLLLNHYKMPLLILSIIIGAITIFTLLKLAKKNGYSRYLMPLFFAFVTGFFTLESFERWRVYLPSVGIFIFCVVIAYDIFFWLNKKYLKGLFAAALLLLFGFHTLRVVNAEQNWREASHELQKLKEEIKPILAAHPERPLKLLFLTKPAKLGGAPLMQLALTDFLSQAELERTNDASLVTGGKPYDGIEGEPAVSLYTTEENKNFSGLSVEKINDSSYRVSVTNDSQIKLIPAINKEEGIAKRDQEFKDGDTLRSDLFLLIFEKTEKVTAQRIRVEIIDRSYLPLYYIEGKWHADNADGTDFHR